MKLTHHISVSLIVSAALYTSFRSVSMAVTALFVGIFIDLDHILDYLREHDCPFNVKKFFRVCYEHKFEKMILVWHAWEWIVLMGFSAWLTDWHPVMTGIFIGMTHHLLMDAFHIDPVIRGYSIIWRWRNDFDFLKSFGPRVEKFDAKFLNSQTTR
ncbi:MAG: hypothetical protein ISR96_05060 [Nitrospira sp.]|nr:hypothetical protein [bacterium]MBL7048873.1 hypothetical protein [Nitrospira sp.]